VLRAADCGALYVSPAQLVPLFASPAISRTVSRCCVDAPPGPTVGPVSESCYLVSSEVRLSVPVWWVVPFAFGAFLNVARVSEAGRQQPLARLRRARTHAAEVSHIQRR
jgi:hypothetical protein